MLHNAGSGPSRGVVQRSGANARRPLGSRGTPMVDVLRREDDGNLYEPIDRDEYRRLKEEADLDAKPQYCTCCCRRCRCATRRKCVLVNVVVLLFLASTALLLQFVVLPRIIQNAMDKADLVFLNTAFIAPHGEQVTLYAKVKVRHSPDVKATLHATDFNMMWVPSGNSTCPDHPSAPACSVGVLHAKDIDLHGDGDIELNDMFDVTHSEVFDSFGNELVEERFVTWQISGSVSITAHFWKTSVTFHGIDFTKQATLTGLAGLHNVSLGVFDAVITPENQVEAVLTVNVENPSIISMDTMGNLSLDIIYKDTYLGTAHTLKPVDMKPGLNAIPVRGLITPKNPNSSAVSELFSNFLSGRETSLSARGAASGASSIPLYSPILKNLLFSTPLHPMAHPLAFAGELNVTQQNVIAGLWTSRFTFPVRLLLHNPFSAPVIFTHVDLDVIFNSMHVANANLEYKMEVPGKTSMWTCFIPVTLNPKTIKAAFEVSLALTEAVIGGRVLLGTEGTVSATVGNLAISPHYSQPETIPTCTSANTKPCLEYVRSHPTWPVSPEVWNAPPCYAKA